MGPGGSGWQRGSAVFYRFSDSSGRVHIVDSLDLVPTAQRERAERVQYAEQSRVPAFLPEHVPTGWPGIALLLGVAALLWLGFRYLPSSLRVVLRVALVASVVALLGGAYFGWTRRLTHQSSDLLSSPSALIEDAQRAVNQMNARMKVQQDEIREAERSK